MPKRKVNAGTFREKIRDRAVTAVDARHGYTMEFAPSPAAHRAEYEAEEDRLVAQVANDPGLAICQHDDRTHYLGGGGAHGAGGIWICFACWAKLIMGVRR